MSKPQLNLILTQNLNIYEQLQLEEALLRTDKNNWCLINNGSSPAIVLGISSKLEEVVHTDHLLTHPIPLIRRFTGGGTVVVDQNTLFTTFIFNSNDLDISTYPQPILRWGKNTYQSCFPNLPFDLHENDFVIGNYKCGGNAQYLTKNRWLLHTSWLWDFDMRWMHYLSNPPRQPSYRRRRSHEDFLRPLYTLFSNKGEFLDALTSALSNRFRLTFQELHVAQEALTHPHRKATKFLVLDPEYAF